MNVSMHGKAIAYIELDPMWTQDGNPRMIRSGVADKLTLSATHHGDHDEFWVVSTHTGGYELARWRCAGIQHIGWENP